MDAQATIEIYRGAENLFHWRMKDERGEILCWSKHAFKTAEAARSAALSMRRRGAIPTKPALHEIYSATAKWSLDKY